MTTLYTDCLIEPLGLQSTLLTPLCSHFDKLSILLGLSPLSYLTGSTTHSVQQENMLSGWGNRLPEAQGLIRLEWKFPWSGDVQAPLSGGMIRCEPKDLCNFLFHVYLEMFPHESMSQQQDLMRGAKLFGSVPHYTRSCFAAFLALIKSRIIVDWDFMVLGLVKKISSDRELVEGTNHLEELFLGLHLSGLYDYSTLRRRMDVTSFFGPVSDPLHKHKNTLLQYGDLNHVCVTLTVPRSKVRVMYDNIVKGFQPQHPMFQLYLLTPKVHYIFSSLYGIFGKLVIEQGSRKCTIEEETKTWIGNSDLHIFGYIPTHIFLTSPHDVNVSLRFLKTRAGFMHFLRTFGPELEIFQKPLLDDKFVHIVESLPGLHYRSIIGGVSQQALWCFGRVVPNGFSALVFRKSRPGQVDVLS